MSAIKKAEPIQYKPKENQPNPKNQADKKILKEKIENLFDKDQNRYQ